MVFVYIFMFSRFFFIILMQLFLQMNFAYSHIEFTKNCEKNVIKLIENSKESIDIAVYSINNLNIVEALLDAKE
ncbi:MAG: hypothetical protein RL208_312, partial [Pseudomonadota bacterium]